MAARKSKPKPARPKTKPKPRPKPVRKPPKRPAGAASSTSAPAPAGPVTSGGPPASGEQPPRVLGGPVFAQPQPTADPTMFHLKHPSDNAVYAQIDQLNREHLIKPLPFPAPRGGVEPILTLEQVLGGSPPAKPVDHIVQAGQIVFHSTGDCGSTRGPRTQNLVTDKMLADFQESSASELPQFALLLGDVVYSFGEVAYYYDQFYEPYRDYPAPILAAAGNHDGMVAPDTHVASLAAFLRNFCADTFVVNPEAGGLSRTAQIQPGVFFTFDAPFVRVIVLYSNTLEDPGVIASPEIGNSQLDFLKAALQRVKSESYKGALLFAFHHPPFTATGSKHGPSNTMLTQMDDLCTSIGVWPHAVLAGHAHNYQRFTRTRGDGTQIPYITCGNGGHNVQRLQKTVAPASGSGTGAPVVVTALRTPQIVQPASRTQDQVVFENYDDQNYGYLRVIVNAAQLRIEYHPASDGPDSKTPDDAVTVDLATRKLTHFTASDLGHTQQVAVVHQLAAAQPAKRPGWKTTRPRR